MMNEYADWVGGDDTQGVTSPRWASDDVTPQAMEQAVGQEVAADSYNLPDAGETAESPQSPDEIRRLMEDVNRIKSTFQRREEELRRQMLAQQEQLQAYLMQLEAAKQQEQWMNLPEEERRVVALEQNIRQMQTQLEQLQQERIAEENRRAAARALGDRFGLDADELYRVGESPEAMIDYIAQQFKAVKAKVTQQPQPPRVTAPSVPKPRAGLLQRWESMTPEERRRVIEQAATRGIPLEELTG